MSTCYRTLRRIEYDANAALCELSGLSAEVRVARKYLDRIWQAANRELAKAPIKKMKMREPLRESAK